MRRVLPADEFRAWFRGFLPGAAKGEPKALFEPATVTDRTDPQLVHLDGLNLSRGVVHAGRGRGAAGGRPGPQAPHRVGGEARRGGAEARGERRLRGRTLAGVVRRVPAPRHPEPGVNGRDYLAQSFAARLTAWTKLDTSATPCQAMSNAVP